MAGEAISQWDAVLVKTADKSAYVVDDVDNTGIVGIAQESVEAGSSLAVCIGGVSKVKAGGSITRGSKLGSNTSGKAVNLGAASRMIGIALEGAASDGILPAIIQIGEKKA